MSASFVQASADQTATTEEEYEIRPEQPTSLSRQKARLDQFPVPPDLSADLRLHAVTCRSLAQLGDHRPALGADRGWLVQPADTEYTAYAASAHAAASCLILRARSGEALRTGLPGRMEHRRANPAGDSAIFVSSLSLPANTAGARDQRGGRPPGAVPTARRSVPRRHTDRRRVYTPEEEDFARRCGEGSN